MIVSRLLSRTLSSITSPASPWWPAGWTCAAGFGCSAGFSCSAGEVPPAGAAGAREAPAGAAVMKRDQQIEGGNNDGPVRKIPSVFACLV